MAIVHYKSFFDPGEYVECADLAGRDVTVTIESVAQGKLGRGKQESKKPVISIVGEKKKFAVNKTNGKIIAGLYGPDVSVWKGKRITLYGTTTQFGGETVECIRVRPVVPPPAVARNGRGAAPAQLDAPPPAEPPEPGSGDPDGGAS